VTSLRADLDDLTSRLASLSEFELSAAKEKILAKSVAFAAGIGILFGMLISRR
jgi:hypothetical protein